MSVLSPSTPSPCLPNSKFHHHFPPLRTKPPDSRFSSFCKLFHPQNQPPRTTRLRLRSSISATQPPVLVNHWLRLLQISIESRGILLGLAAHALLVKSGPENDAFPGNNLINMYSKFGRLEDAQGVFEEMIIRNTITWTSLMNGYSGVNDFESVFRIAQEMHRSGEEINEHTCTVVLRACGFPQDRSRGEQIHGLVIKSGFEKNVFVGTSLVSMYSRSGSLDDAERVLKELDDVDVRCLNSMILEYRNAGDGEKAIRTFSQLQASGLEPNDYTFTNVISACHGKIGAAEGRQFHGLAIKYGFTREISVGNALITMYGKHGLMEDAERMLCTMDERNLVSRTALISGYVKNGYGEKAIFGFMVMLDMGMFVDSNCLATIIDGCSEYKSLGLGLQVHGFVEKLGYISDAFVGTALVDMYAKHKDIRSAALVFNSLSNHSITSFNAILTGYIETDGGHEDVMVLFSRIRSAGIRPDAVTFSLLLDLSADQASLVQGKSLHAYTIKAGLESETTVGNAAVTMYAKCGSIEDAYQMFNGMDTHDSITWNAAISAFALHGQGKKAWFLFEEMQKRGYQPDELTLLAVLQACCYSGLCEDGFRLFNAMVPSFGIKPVIEHYACMVDLLGRGGRLSEAMEFIKGSPFASSPLLWRTLVNVCKLQRDFSIGKVASKFLLDLAPEEAASYILVSNLYTAGGMLNEAAKVRTMMNDRKVSKEVGCSWIEIENRVHRFVASGKDHPASREIYASLHKLRAQMAEKCDPTIDLKLPWNLE
ncbi:PREDICTED: pentatricopeptide repeat-containing protein At2g33680-like [Nelumbo nucifera]|uniref:Pentatricopeptide repeat-containing protein At2g33680 n=2 Tax=Nelumbo nucifera TaxID=4432 RepID=A0A822ZB77_NELNU|nr:PREDICTED: pentatricopeptide repeat-containing protein At2g33680-like [Nelumbo nucifera]DAD42372.1 TPA_asm: hypothetical protein HUJ06_000602 [Nelumbo nucifera]